jgi:hypothetical protein
VLGRCRLGHVIPCALADVNGTQHVETRAFGIRVCGNTAMPSFGSYEPREPLTIEIVIYDHAVAAIRYGVVTMADGRIVNAP